MIDAPAQRFLPWAGANTMNAPRVGELLEGCRYAVVLFAGGMCEVPWITARQIVVNDLHRDAINLGRCVADPAARRALLNWLRWLAVSDENRDWACDLIETGEEWGFSTPHERAVAYFVSQWMGRSAQSGTPRELSGSVPIRTNANGGGTARRFWSAVRSLAAWGETLRRCDFSTLDWRQCLDQYGQDIAGHGLYADPPSWPGAKVAYTHSFTPADHEELAIRLSNYSRARVVVRYGDHPTIRELYARPGWTIHECDGRTQSNAAIRELLIVRN